MVVRSEGSSRRSTARLAWLHLAVLVALAAAVEVLILALGGDLDRSTLGAVVPGYFYAMLPVAAAVSMGMSVFDEATVRHAVVMVGITTAAMAGLDLVPPTLTVPEAQQLAFNGGVFERRAMAAELHGSGAIRTLLAFMRGDLALVGERLTTYAPDEPRLMATMAASTVGYLAFPGILIGIVLGVQAWVARNVRFRRTVDERVARLVLAWLFAPAAFFVVVTWVRRVQVQVLFGSSGLAAMFFPYVTFALIATVGWVTAWRASRWTAH